MATQQQPPRGGGGRPGAMTMAMQAVKTVQGPKVLRIGVIQGGKIIEERIIRNRDTVSVGTTEKNTFTIAAPDFPAHFELFPLTGNSYKLNFTEAMEGRVAMPQGVQSLQQLKQSGQATRSNIGWQVALNEQCRGKVSVGDVTFLFQFVAPPPPQPRPQLPAAIRAGWVKNIDWTYNACMAFFLVLAFGAFAYDDLVYDPEIEDNFALDVRTVTLVTPPAPDEPPPAEANTAAADSSQPSPSPTPAPAPTPHPQTEAQRQAHNERQAAAASAAAERAAAAAMSALNNSAEFAALTGATDTGHGSAADRLAAGGLMQGSVDALANTGGVSTASGSGLRRGGLAANAGGLGGGGLGAGRTVSGGGAGVGSGGEVVVERTIRGSASVASGDVTGGEGDLDANAIYRVLRAAQGGFQSCYERALRNNPTLAGRLDIHFTIGTSGRITGSPNVSGLSAAPEVSGCVGSRIRSLVFPAPNGGSVEFSFPISFTPGG